MLSNVPGMITCQEFDNFLVDYFELALPANQSRKFRLHVLMCPDCRRYLTGYRRIIELTGASSRAADEAVPDEVPEELVQAILSARRTDPTSK